MSEDVNRRLAQRLDAIPNGFPSTESGIELKLLAKIFTEEEAHLAAVMRLTKEPAESIASRAGVSLKDARRQLKAMARKGLILASKGKGELVYGLMPFVWASMKSSCHVWIRNWRRYLSSTTGRRGAVATSSRPRRPVTG